MERVQVLAIKMNIAKIDNDSSVKHDKVKCSNQAFPYQYNALVLHFTNADPFNRSYSWIGPEQPPFFLAAPEFGKITSPF